ncbi:GNAT family N-acetyltransferase [Isachenkonia alkalipeptolytica]|uniref:GNAT family N-acetyltransferase n=1 Tax=Isachenkonia alkalipeptolytica TaxID=2565777 RepID=A0AA43XML2_9CLOT|nr:GNAT family N-acetyltransferase [Isachenkonia alkalipeptolytica]NBG89598.1 GNAT family N-acetyltransferase [Isachenkonia alkalipeptolytica]
MTDIQPATESARSYFINDYLSRYGSFQDLAEQYADACIFTNRSLVATINDKIIGGITWSIKEGINSGLVEIFQMSILKEYRGKGYGSLLVEKCLQDIESFYCLRGYPLQRVYIIITESNIIGRNLYRNKDFYVAASLMNHRFVNQMDLFYVKDYFIKN